MTTTGPLDGLVVADLSRVLAGPYCSMLLADLGATVIKVESAAGDDTRSWTPPALDGVATYYLSINRNKHSIVLDYNDPDDVAVVHELFRRADIVIENFKVGGLAKFGLDYESAHAINPALIYLSISGFGTAGGAALPGYDLVVQAVSGLMSLTGEPDGAPYRAGISVFDVMTGMHGTIGVLAALQHRNATGEGQHVEVNLLSSALSGLVNHSGAFAAAGEVPFRMGNAHPSVYPYQPMPTADRDVIVAVGNDRQFRAFAKVIGRPELADDDRFRLNADRTNHRDELHPILLEALSEWSADDLFLQLNQAGVPCGPINSIAEGVGLAEQLGLDPIVRMGEQGIGLIRNPITMSATAPRYDRPPPALGQDTDAVLRWLDDPGAPSPSDLADTRDESHSA
ncbi:MAG: CoA transferase [Acidimicrobiales bacterium]